MLLLLCFVWSRCVQALGRVPSPGTHYPRRNLLVSAATSLLRDTCPALALLLEECLVLNPMEASTRPCAREVLDRLLAIGVDLGMVQAPRTCH